MTDTPKARAYTTDGAQASIKAETFWLDLGHLRAVLAAADRLGMTDNAAVSLEGVAKSYSRVDEYTAQRIILRSENYTQIEAAR